MLGIDELRELRGLMGYPSIFCEGREIFKTLGPAFSVSDFYRIRAHSLFYANCFPEITVITCGSGYWRSPPPEHGQTWTLPKRLPESTWSFPLNYMKIRENCLKSKPPSVFWQFRSLDVIFKECEQKKPCVTFRLTFGLSQTIFPFRG